LTDIFQAGKGLSVFAKISPGTVREGIGKLSGKLRKGAASWDIDRFWEFCI